MADQKFTSEVEVKGADKGAKDFDRVAKAQEGLKDQTSSAAEESSKAAKAQAKLSASESDYIQILNQINPVLGALVDSMLKGGKVAGDLASQNINLSGAFQKATGAIKANAGALKLLLAGGAVVAGILLIARAVSKMGEEFDRATKAIHDQIDAQTELRKQERERQRTLEELADLRREGGFATGEEARGAAHRVERVRAGAPFLDEQAIIRAVALGGRDRSIEDLGRIAFLIQSGRLELDPARPGAGREREIESALEHFAGIIDRTFQRERQQQTELFREALRDMNQIGGSIDALIQVIESQRAGEGVDARRLAKMLLVLPRVEEILERAEFGDFGAASIMQQALKQRGITVEGDKLSTQELAILRQLVQTLRAGVRESGDTSEAVGAVVHNHFENAKFTYPDSATQRRHTVNGENLARSRER